MNTSSELKNAIQTIRSYTPQINLALEHTSKNSEICANMAKMIKENNFFEHPAFNKKTEILTNFLKKCDVMTKIENIAKNHEPLLRKLESCSSVEKRYSDTSSAYKSLCQDVLELAGNHSSQFSEAYNEMNLIFDL